MPSLNLVIQLESKLDLPRIVGSKPSGSNFTEVSTGKVARVRNRSHPVAAEIRCIEGRVIEDVKELSPELHGEALADRDILECGEVELG